MTGHRRRAVRGTVVAAAATAVLTASQAPGAPASALSDEVPAITGPSVSGDSPYRTELPPLQPRGGAGTDADRTADRASDGGVATAGALPATVLTAYRRAEAALTRSTPGCRLRWQLLAAIGQVESGQARGGRVTPDGTTLTPILGPRLDGNGFALIRDTDGGTYDGDPVYDRAVGPMQFIPSTWAVWGADGNGDGRSDPGNIHDAALAAGRYLCAGGRDLSHPNDLDRAILGYNRSEVYLRTVRAWLAYFLEGHRVMPDRGGAAGAAVRPRPETSGTGRPEPSPSRAPARPGRPGDGGADGPASQSPSPSPSKTWPTGGAGTPAEPAMPVPANGVEVPGGEVLPTTDPVVGNGTDSLAATPSPTPDTGR
ncbi:lytic transglycosylase domain-containing protein [Streptomyces sp. NBC_01619]|uniref:lytic transglycosylase domain-containing protein n=1 Tax=Streptomyces sp. NBC_01619 TaxID=2975901 RepID=UPI002250FE27|nr:lytic murein transglycosylase [Streptomyces sp. NBC_01619]MCX4514701.1 lytic transglycosylase domain-containing protein [Streptomyces sp. NBC_01619]